MREGLLLWRPIPGLQKPTTTATPSSSCWWLPPIPPSSKGGGEEGAEHGPGFHFLFLRNRHPHHWGPFASVSLREGRRDKGERPGDGRGCDDGGSSSGGPLRVAAAENGVGIGDGGESACPSAEQLLTHPLALLALVPREAALFSAGAIAGAAAKTLTAPLDRVKLLMQTHGLRAVEGGAGKGIGFLEAITLIGKEEGIRSYWKGNLLQVIRIIPYSAVQLFSYEVYKKLFRGKDGELSVIGRLVAGACAGMTSTLVTYPLDVLRLRLAVEPGCRAMSQVALNMLRDEGIASFYSGLGPSLLGIAPYIAVNFCIFDLVKKSLPEKYQKKPESSLVTAVLSATLATLMCYPLDTVRRQMQMKGTPYDTVLDALPGIVERDGFLGLYQGFVPNTLKNLPNSSIRLTTFDTVKGLIATGQKELQRIIDENRVKLAS